MPKATQSTPTSPQISLKPVVWIGSTKKDLSSFPDEVRRECGQALFEAQAGGRHPSVKPLKGSLQGVNEVVSDFDGDTFRAIYTVELEGVVYALDAFQKKSTTKDKTAVHDIQRIKKRFDAAKEHHKVNYQKKDTG